MIELLLVGAGGFVGAVTRYLVSGWRLRRFGAGFPYGTLAVNVVGCLLIGAAMVLIDGGRLGPRGRLFWTIGLLGALTTFSTFGYETLERVRDGNWLAAAGNVLLNVALALAAVVAGRAAMQAIVGPTGG